MLEQLSESRRKLLLSLGLCSAADLRRAARHVRRLARDLPAFDSVWLDALVQLGKLTGFQAKLLESAQPERIQVGPCVLAERLGAGPLGQTFLCSAGTEHEPRAVKLLTNAACRVVDGQDRIAGLIESLRGLDHPSIAAPLVCAPVNDQLAVLSRFVAGPHLGELLIRRGRFPAMIVVEIARQLADGLSALEQRAVVHGDIRAANVRLTKTGAAVLVDVGIRAALDSELSVHSGLPPDRYDGVAPELIGVVASPTTASDMYALGCLLWQLLAGRPPFPGGDPLLKLAAHQTRRVDDVRNWAPETPAPLADEIARMTSRSPSDRPASFSEVLAHLDLPRWRGRRRLAAFRRWFDAPAPIRLERTGRLWSSRWLAAAGIMGVAGLGVWSWNDPGARAVLLSWKSRLPELATAGGPIETTPSAATRPTGLITPDSRRSPRDAAPADATAEKMLELPAPDQLGVMHLPSRGPYLARDIAAVGNLIIRGEGPALSEIVVVDRPFTVTAETARLENVQIRQAIVNSALRDRRQSLAVIEAQTVHLEHCSLLVADAGGEITPTSAAAASPSLSGLVWKLSDPRDPRGGRGTFHNTLLLGGDCGVRVSDSARRIEFINCLRLHGGPLCELSAPPDARRETVVRLSQTTCRDTFALFRMVHSLDSSRAGRIMVEANDCVFDLTPPAGCLFDFTAVDKFDWASHLKFTGEGSLAPATLVTAVHQLVGGSRTPLESPGILVEGIMTGPYTFTGPSSTRPADSEVLDSEAPRRATAPPGIHAADLPAANGNDTK